MIVNNTIENNLYDMSKSLNLMHLQTFYIVSIIIDEQFECNITEIKEPSNIIHIEVGLKFFYEKFLNNPDHDF
jgi:hypothetical protein